MIRGTLILAFVATIAVLSAQSPTPNPIQSGLTFEVASIKRNTSGSARGPGARSVGIQPGGRFTMVDGSLLVVIRSAYPDATDIIGAPEWVSTERYDVETRAIGDPTRPQVQDMLRRLLADRLKLVVHAEIRESPTYALVLARSDGRLGPQLRRYTGDCAAYIAAVRQGGERPQMPTPSSGAPACGYMVGGGRMVSGGTALGSIAAALPNLAGRPIVDKTGLAGDFEFTIDWNGDLSVFTALEEQLGLKLEPERNPLSFLVIDSIERPTEN